MVQQLEPVYRNDLVYIEVEPAEIPWLKIFTTDGCKEFSQCSAATRAEVFELLHLIELEMLYYFKPDKINIASFANYLPQVHWHIMARYQNDSFFPEPVWGSRQREASPDLPPMDVFVTGLQQRLHAR